MDKFFFHTWDSKSELLKKLEDSNSILIGERREGLKQFFSLSLDKGIVGICSYNNILKPSAFNVSKQSLLILGVDENLYVIDVNSFKITGHFNLGSQFYELISIRNGSFLVIYELGVLCLSSDARLIWKKDTDVIEDFFSDYVSEIRLNTMSGELILSTESGKEKGH